MLYRVTRFEGADSSSFSKSKSPRSRSDALLKEVGGLLEAHDGILFLTEGVKNQDEITEPTMSFKWYARWNGS